MKITKIFFTILFLSIISLSATAQSIKDEIAENPNKSGGVYFAYTYNNPKQTHAPKGYKPFYISHYGRHGSRWLLTDDEYINLKKTFDQAFEANALTEFGKDVYNRVAKVYENGICRGGDLTPLGAEQHREIAERMYKSFPEVFKGDAVIDAKSTYVVRCVLSMAAFCEGLKEQNPKLRISREAGKRTTSYLNFFSKPTNPNLSQKYLDYMSDGEWKEIQNEYAKENIHPERLMKKLFSNKDFINSINQQEVILSLFYFANSAQNIDIDVSFYDLFTTDELYAINVYDNYRYFAHRGSTKMNKRYPQYYAKILVEDVLKRADEAVEGKSIAADLRFGHDGNVMPIAGLLRLKGCHEPLEGAPEKIAEKWSVFKLTPMAANIQIVFYRNGSDDVLVKFLHNEKETEIPIESDIKPFYRWKDVREFYRKTLDELTDPALN